MVRGCTRARSEPSQRTCSLKKRTLLCSHAKKDCVQSSQKLTHQSDPAACRGPGSSFARRGHHHLPHHHPPGSGRQAETCPPRPSIAVVPLVAPVVCQPHCPSKSTTECTRRARVDPIRYKTRAALRYERRKLSGGQENGKRTAKFLCTKNQDCEKRGPAPHSTPPRERFFLDARNRAKHVHAGRSGGVWMGDGVFRAPYHMLQEGESNPIIGEQV